MRLAIYGKGGIGKSTVSANLTAALTGKGMRVLQIGCDPKHDSTRLLLGGMEPRTVMEYIRSTSKGERHLADVVVEGYGGCLCVEAGGPEPGVGCAGRGILSTFELLDEMGVDGLKPDVTIYDVLGDVVCGGFAVPLRNDYAEKVIVVTSGEYMSIYAANNILRGVRNYDPRRMGGIIFNSRGDDEERERVRAFAEAVGLPVIAEIPRSPLFLEAEKAGGTVVENFPEDSLAHRFHVLAEAVLGRPCHEASPLSDGELERIVLGKEKPREPTESSDYIDDHRTRPRTPPAYTSRNVDRQEVLHGCAFTGAVVTCLSVTGLHTVMHSPNSCAHLSCQLAQNAARRAFLKEGVAIPSFLAPRAQCSSMDDPSMVFGGTPLLEEALRKALSDTDTVAVVTSCPSGIIGDDVLATAKRINSEHPGSRIVTIIEDGNVAGDHMQGVIDAGIALADALIRDVDTDPDLLNVVGIKPIATNIESSMRHLERILGMVGMRINCRFIGGTSVEAIEGFSRAGLSILANTDRFAFMLAKFLEEQHGARFLHNPLSTGMAATEALMRELAEMRGMDVEDCITALRQEYMDASRPLRDELEGRTVSIISMHKDIDWVIDLVDDMGMELLKAVVVDRSDHLMDYHISNRHAARMEFLEDYDMEEVMRSCLQSSPDLLLSTYPVDVSEPIVQGRIPMVPDMGHLAPLELARRWALALKAPIREGWRDDDV